MGDIMNVYDFDKTIYSKDCTVDFLFYSLKKKPSLVKYLPGMLYGIIAHKLGWIDRKAMKQWFYNYIKDIDDIDKDINDYWDLHINEMNSFYFEKQKEDDLVISASATYMVSVAMERMGIKHLIATDVDKYTGEVLSSHCKGAEKVVRMVEAGYKLEDMDEFYSDSYTDVYLAREAKKAFLIKNGKVTEWDRF